MYKTDHQEIAVSQTNEVLGPNGKVKDILERLVVTVTTADATSAVTIKDGSGSVIPIIPPSTPVGVYSVRIGARSISGAWKVTTLAGATVMAIGRFS